MQLLILSGKHKTPFNITCLHFWSQVHHWSCFHLNFWLQTGQKVNVVFAFWMVFQESLKGVSKAHERFLKTSVWKVIAATRRLFVFHAFLFGWCMCYVWRQTQSKSWILKNCILVHRTIFGYIWIIRHVCVLVILSLWLQDHTLKTGIVRLRQDNKYKHSLDLSL